MSADQYVFGEVPVDAKVTTPRASPEKIVGIAKEIWNEILKSKVPKDDEKGSDELLEKLQKKYSDFQNSFPLVLRWMVQMRKFNVDAFNKYLLKHASADMSSREKFLELQAEYLVLLYREENRHKVDEAFVRRYREQLVKQLIDEDKAFLKIQKDVDEEFSKREADNDADRRQRLYEYIQALKERANE